LKKREENRNVVNIKYGVKSNKLYFGSLTLNKHKKQRKKQTKKKMEHGKMFNKK